MSSIARSDLRMTSNISPNVPSFSVKPAALASAMDSEPCRRPTATRTLVPASDSFRFWAWARPRPPPADDADLRDPRQRLGQQAEEVSAAAKEALLHAVELDFLDV